MNEITINQTAGIVECDFESVKAYLNEQLAVYKGMVFTEDSKATAKKSVAELRKGKKAFAERVKEAKAEYMKPWDEFNAKATELTKMFDEPIEFINGQVEEFEKARIEAKRVRAMELLDTYITEDARQLFWNDKRIFNDKWLNATYSEKNIIEDINELNANVETALRTIQAMHSECEERAVEQYQKTMSLNEAVLYINSYEIQRKEILERQQAKEREAEIERVRAEERAKIEAEMKQAKAIEEAKAEAVEMLTPTDIEAEAHEYTYNITLTPDAKAKLEMWLDSVGIEYSELVF